MSKCNWKSGLHLLMMSAIVLCLCTASFATISFSSNTLTYSSPSDLSTTIDPAGQKDVTNSYGITKSSFQALNPQVVGFNGAPTASQTLRTLVVNYTASSTVTFTFPTAMYNYGSATTVGRGSFSGSNARDAISTVPVQNGSLYDWLDATITTTGGQGVQSLGFCAAFRNDQAVPGGQILYTLSDSTTDYVTLPSLGGGGPEYVFIGYTAPTGKTITRVQASRTSTAGGGYVSVDDLAFVMSADTTPPAAVSNLSCSNLTTTSVQLNWTAPGDDGNTGTATTYDIRYSTSTITAGNFSSATAVTGLPAPAAAGTNQNVTVSGLTADTTYYFAMKTADEVPNWSTISNVPSAHTVDSVAPAAVSNLSCSNLTTTSVQLNWTAPGDNGSSGTATTYDIRYSTSTITAGNFSSATAVTGLPAPAAAGTNQNVTVSGLTADTTYYFAMKTADEVPNWSTISNVPSAHTVDSVAPAAVSNLATGSITASSITLSWTAPGDNGSTGTATSYDIRYSTSTITAGNFSSATAVTGVPAPAVAGTNQNVTVSGLSGDTTYYFAMKTADEVPNWSTISNVPSAKTSDTVAPAAVSNLATSSPTGTSITLSWTAPGDNGSSGTATSYDIRYSTSAITAGNFSSATAVSGAPAPAVAGTNQNMVVSGLSPNTTYYFAIKTADEVPNWSAISNVPTGTTADTVAPAAVSNLATSSPTSSSITLSWTAPGDDGSTGTATTYDIRYSTSTITAGNFSSATQVTGAPAPAAAGTNQNMVVSGLSASTTYYFAMKTADEVPNWSTISNVPSGTTSAPADTTPPAAVSNLATSSPTSTSITLTWTAPGDDGSTGTATTYDIRYSTSTITAGNFSSATQVTGAPAPQVAGTNQNVIVSGLSASTTYYFAMKTADEVPNWSTISNVPSGTTSAPPAGAIVALKRDAGLTAGGATDLRFNNCTVRTVTVSDTGLDTAGEARWYNEGASSAAGSYSLYKFDLSSIPNGATINLAQLRLYHTQGNGGAGDGAVSRITTHSWIEGTQSFTCPGAAGGASYAHPNGYNTGPNQNASGGGTAPLQSWGTTNDQFFSLTADAESPISPSSAPTGTGYHVYDVTSHVQAWVNGTKSNYGWAQSNGYWDFHFSEAGTAYEPVLFVDYGSASDTTPPAAVSNLATGSITASSITLSWTSPGDDGNTGTATTYDIRYSTSTITAGNFSSATAVTGVPAPAAAGTNQNVTVSGLSVDTTYYFAIMTADEVPNWSTISNVPSAKTSDTVAPAAVSNLATSSPTGTSVTLSWTAPGDNGSSGTATTYDIRYSTSTITAGNFSSATQVTGAPAPQVAGTNQNMVVSGLSPNTTYYFAMKTADEVPNWSTISNAPSATTADTVAPAAVSNLATSSPTSSSITLSWTAPGDDGNTGTATTYDIRYSTSTITAGNFSSATAVTGVPAPQVAGTNQNVVVSGLSASTTYYFAMKTADEVPNWSTISNVPSGTTSAPPAGAIVALKRDAGLTAGGATDSRFNSATVRTVAVADTGLNDSGLGRWYNNGAASAAGPYSLYRFDLSSIPNGSTINLAQLRLYHTQGNGGLGNGDVSTVITHNWLEGTQSGTYPGAAGGASYAHPIGYNTGPSQDANGGTTGSFQTWGTNSDSFFSLTADANSSISPSSAPSGTGYHVYDVTSHVQSWVNGTKSNYGWALYNGNWDFHFSEAGTAQEPVLFVDYSGGSSDTTPPAAVANLATSSPTSSSITLSWTAPGDDGNTGTATTYDIRYSTSAITAGNFSSATQVTGAPAPQVAGTNQSMTVSGLATSTTYYFAMKTADEVPNWSTISNVPSGTTTAASDTTPPAAVSNLATSSPTSGSITLTWTAPGDDGSTGTATTYDIRYRTGGAIDSSNWASATQVSGEPAPQVAGTNQSMIVTGLSASTTYYFAIKTADEVPNWSAISNSPSGTTSAPGSSTIVALKRDNGLLAGGSIDSRFNGATVRTVTVSDTGLYNAGFSRWANGGAATVGGNLTLYKFDVSSIPADSTVNLAQLRIYHTSGNGAQGDANVARIITHNWTEGTGTGLSSYPGAAGGASFAHPIGYNTTPGQDANGGTTGSLMTWGPNSDSFFDMSADTDLLVTPSDQPTGVGYHITNVTTHVQQWVNGVCPNYGFAQIPGAWDMHCSEAGTDQEPVLFVDYTPGGGSDSTPPAAVSNLATSSPTATSLTLSWTAPGDDGNTGTAASYDIRYRTGGAVTTSNWLTATQVTGEPTPLVAGTNQSMTINGLTPGVTYYFAMKTTDDAYLTSAISNSPWGTTSIATDTTAPAQITNLAAGNPSIGTVTLTWTAPGDDGSTGTATLYDVRYRTGGAVTDANWASATQATGAPLPGLAGTTQKMTISSLTANTTYYFGIKTIDKVANTSTLSNSPSATTPTLGTGNNKPILRPQDFHYLGYYIVAPTQSGEINYGQSFTHRYVSGQLRFLTMSYWGTPDNSYELIEFAPPANLGGTITTGTNHWQDIYAGTGWTCPGGFVHLGLWYEQAQNRLWSTWALDYPGEGFGNDYSMTLVTRTLNADGSISNLAGPWGLEGVQQRRIYGGAQAIPSWFQSTYSVGPYACGWGGYSSLAAQIGPVSAGPTFYAIPEPTGYPSGNGSIPASAFKTLMDYHTGWLPDWYSSGWPTSGDRGVRDSDVNNEYDNGNWTSPCPDGLGRWSWDTSNNTGAWIETPNRQGFITVPEFQSGRTWYESSAGHCERRTSEIQVFDPNVLGQVAQGTRACWDTKPTYRRSVTDECRALGLLNSEGSGYPSGASYDSTTQKFYIFCPANQSANSCILVYDVDNGTGPINDVAIAEISTCGTTTGKRANTETNDGVYESIQESLLGGTSQLDHKWIFQVTGGSSVVFNVKAYHNSNSDGDDFVFAYSTNGTTWTNMVTVTKTTDDGNFQTYTMPAGTSGTVYVRVQDTDRTAGHSNMDSIYIDQLFFRSNP